MIDFLHERCPAGIVHSFNMMFGNQLLILGIIERFLAHRFIVTVTT